MTKGEAELKAEALKLEMGNKICPLLGKKCVACDCISYIAPKIVHTQDGYDCYPSFCTNVLNDYQALAEAIGDEINRNLN